MVFLILLCWLLAVIATVKSDDEFCNASDPLCRKVQLLSDKLNTANQENRRLQTMLNTLVCKDIKCENGGSCYASNDAHATCVCPHDYAGDRCENQITCSQDCGLNAECLVVDHTPVCRCHRGFAKGADNTCIQKTYTAYIQGDPHYTTFDGLSYTYHGRCWAHLFKRCNNSNDESFQIRGLNAVYIEGQRWSNLKTLLVIIRGKQFQFQDQTLIVDGRVRSLPYCCGNVTVNGDNRNILLSDTETGATVRFQPYLTTIIVPHTDFFVGKNNFCGLLGSIDGDCKDDFQFSNGTLTPAPNSCDDSDDSEQRDMLAVGVSDSYIFDHESCETGEDIGYRGCNDPANDTACHLIEQAITGKGPFAACQKLPSLHATLSNCRKDTCFGVSNCVTMTSFVSTCLEAFPWVKLSEWRSIAECPYQCGSHSSYSLQTPVCQETCARNATKKDCDNGFIEGCICDPGYLYDQTSADNSCIAKEECGCLSKDGNYYPHGFGNPNMKALWLGLDNIHILTSTINTTLQVVTQSCPQGDSIGKFTFMQYPSFSVLDASQQYAVVLPVDPYVHLPGDGWINWNTPIGPKFQAFDNSDPDKKQCIDFYEQAGWWYGNDCSYVNLNGKRPDCDKIDVHQHAGYVTWNGYNIKDAYMYVRPAKFSDYDK
uniref:EGF-like domain-containing protein n=1 Tax=Panagrellus redivivus TaxID=6233 RepID=A0A7E4ZUP8_PANRE